MLRVVVPLLLFCLSLSAAAPAPVYVVLWFDTEDYIEPAADDAALRIAQELQRRNVHATFKVVAEKARVLEKRKRFDVIRALSWHDIGYHTNYHSIQPTPALYLKEMEWLEGAQEFERRERPGVADIHRIFGTLPSCYGQPGSSWAPQTFPALLRMGIPVYLDEGEHAGIDDQPFWFGGLLNVFKMGRNLIRPSLDDAGKLPETLEKFDRAVEALRERGGGLISTYYHPTEFVTSKFWDLNFARGANPEPSQWQPPPRFSAADSERRYQVLLRYVEHARTKENLHFVTARELPSLYRSGGFAGVERSRIASHMAARQTFLVTDGVSLSAADMLLALLGMGWRHVDGPSRSGESRLKSRAISRSAFERAKADVVSFINTSRRLPAEVWIGSETMSLGDFAATLAADDGASAQVAIRRANPEMARYIATDAARSFGWPIHPEGFQAPSLLEMARLQAWTLKPALLR
jgi:hypothetical protein